jgi:hypothetical protein
MSRPPAPDLELSFHFSEQCEATLDGQHVAVAFPEGGAASRRTPDDALSKAANRTGRVGVARLRKAPAWTARERSADPHPSRCKRLQFGELK